VFTPSSSPRTTATAHANGLAACRQPEVFTRLAVFARDLGAPDDLLALGDGTMWVSDPVHGTLRHLSTNGETLQLIRDSNAPEGIAVLPDGRLAVAEQRRNRIVTFRPPAVAPTTLFDLPPAGTAEGVDGIALDVAGRQLLVPDSPHGTLVAWQLPDGPSRTIVRGLGRAVDAVAGPNGNNYVTSEAARGLLRIENGVGVQVGAFAQADDVVTKNGLLYVTLIDAGQVVAVDPMTGGGRTLVTGIKAAQGLALLPDGRLAIADSTRGVIGLAPACS
jgi:sugar lactone lactonase YvrE